MDAKLIIGCERSGRVRDAFIKKGIKAVSCDILPTETPGPHLQMDLFEAIKKYKFKAGIFFPPCTHIAVSGAKHFKEKRADGRQKAAIDFFNRIVNLPLFYTAIENPVGIMSTEYRKPDQIIQPYQFGDSYKKTTCLWIKNFPLLKPTKLVSEGDFYISPNGKKLPKWYSNKTIKRDITFPGIANAMADQWHYFI